MKISNLSKVNSIMETYTQLRLKINTMNEIISQQEKTGDVSFEIKFVLSPTHEITINKDCNNIDVLTPLMEYYKKELEKIKQKLKEYGVEFDV